MSLGVPKVLLRNPVWSHSSAPSEAGRFRAQTQGSAPLHPPWAEFLLRLRRVKIPLALCSSRPPDLTTVGFHSTRVDRRNSRTLGYVICVLASGWLGSIMSWGIPRAVGNS